MKWIKKLFRFLWPEKGKWGNYTGSFETKLLKSHKKRLIAAIRKSYIDTVFQPPRMTVLQQRKKQANTKMFGPRIADILNTWLDNEIRETMIFSEGFIQGRHKMNREKFNKQKREKLEDRDEKTDSKAD